MMLFLVTIFFLCMGGLGVFRPAVIVRWAKTAHPDLREDDDTTLWITRMIGAAQLCGGVYMFVLAVRSLTAQ
jgi:hypothetical protein